MKTIIASVFAGLLGLAVPCSATNTFNVSAASFSDFLINGELDPTLNLVRGSNYTFNISAGASHPFWIKSIQSTGVGNAYTNGVTGNGATSGTLLFAVPMNAPTQLFYNCQNHGAMTGVILINDPPLPLQIQSTAPTMNALDVPPGVTITSRFSLATLTTSSVNSSTFKVWGKNTGFYPGSYTVSSNLASMNPGNNFKAGEEVVVMLSTGIIAQSVGLKPPHQFQFRTAAKGCPQFLIGTNGSYGDKFSEGVALGDLDGDGDLDAFVANYGVGSDIYLNNGHGTFTMAGVLGVKSSTHVALGDLDSDGDLDAIVANYFGQGNDVYLNSGTGAFTTNGSLGAGFCWDIALGDLDGDGDLDAFMANDNGESEHVYLNNGNGTFTTNSSLGGKNSLGVALGDLDADGDLDACVVNVPTANGIENDVYLNNGNGTFTTNGTFGIYAGYDVALGDLDSDGDLDAFVANGNIAPEQVFLNDGSASFSASELGAGASSGVALGDLDGDGDLDAFVTNENEEPENVYLNNGDGTFSANKTLGGKSSWGGVALGDLDGDGDLDAFVANYSSGNDVYLNVSCVDTGDFDTDGIPTAFELGSGLNPLDPTDADADSDTDGFTGREEYIADTQPTNGASFFPEILLTNAPSGRTALVIDQTSPGRIYGVFVNTNLLQSPQAWTLVPPEQTGTAAALTLTITNTLPAANYRTGVRLP